MPDRGKAFLIGAGPGAPDLLTPGAMRTLGVVGKVVARAAIDIRADVLRAAA